MTARSEVTRGTPAWRVVMWGGAGTLLLVPLIAMQVTREVNWTALDFVTMAVLLGGAALLVEVAVRMIASPRGRTMAVLGIGAALVLVWLQLAVQLI